MLRPLQRIRDLRYQETRVQISTYGAISLGPVVTHAFVRPRRRINKQAIFNMSVEPTEVVRAFLNKTKCWLLVKAGQVPS